MNTVQTAIDEFLLNCQAEGLAKATVKWYKSLLMAMAHEFEGQTLQAIQTHDLRAYIVKLRESDNRYQNAPQKPQQSGAFAPETIIGHVTALHRFWSWASDEYQLERNPMKGIRKPKRPAPEPRSVSSADYVRLFEAASNTRDKAILALFADSGCRLGGLVGLQVDDLDILNKRATVREKGSKTRIVFYSHFTAQLLQAWVQQRESVANGHQSLWLSFNDGQPLTHSGVYQMIKRLKLRLGISGRTNPHAFRHRFARHFLANGGDVSTLGKLLGHSDLNVTASYYLIFNPDELAQFHTAYKPKGPEVE